MTDDPQTGLVDSKTCSTKADRLSQTIGSRVLKSFRKIMGEISTLILIRGKRAKELKPDRAETRTDVMSLKARDSRRARSSPGLAGLCRRLGYPTRGQIISVVEDQNRRSDTQKKIQSKKHRGC